jgi:hypothetical protein
VNAFELSACGTPTVNDSPAIEPIPPFPSKTTVAVEGGTTDHCAYSDSLPETVTLCPSV